MKKLFPVLFLVAFFVVSVSTIVGAMTTHKIRTGDTLWDLAVKHYGSGTLYTILAEVNHISNPRTIPNGKVIIIPSKKDLEDIRNTSDPSEREKKIGSIGGGSSDKKGSNPNNKDQYVQPREEDFSFENMINRSLSPKSIKSVKGVESSRLDTSVK